MTTLGRPDLGDIPPWRLGGSPVTGRVAAIHAAGADWPVLCSGGWGVVARGLAVGDAAAICGRDAGDRPFFLADAAVRPCPPGSEFRLFLANILTGVLLAGTALAGTW